MKQTLKRKLVQCAAAVITNANLSGFATGTLYRGPLKQVCVPGLNCYSCPGALGSCPIGALQQVISSGRYPVSFYVAGLLLAFGVTLGRFICGFLCPFGLIQEWIHQIPSPKLKLRRAFVAIKYVVLVVFVLLLPLLAAQSAGPAFCRFICPAGTLTGGIPLLIADQRLRGVIGWLFSLKSVILALTLLGCTLIYRFFCRVLCPLGAIYSLFNKISLYQLRFCGEQCVHCGVCAAVCKMGVNPAERPADPECIRCGDCASACPAKALRMGFSHGRRGEASPCLYAHDRAKRPSRRIKQ